MTAAAAVARGARNQSKQRQIIGILKIKDWKVEEEKENRGNEQIRTFNVLSSY